ncbi:small heat shock protein [Infundibulicybe gibba]|nr:small heat shock protein [Infundibulicybe gibba]
MSSSVFYYEPFYDIERFFDEAFNNGSQSNAGNQVQRAIGDAGLPELKKEDVEIEVHNGRLTVSGETHLSSEHDQQGYAIRERRFGKFSRTLQLPQGVKEEDIKASMNDGVLMITFPKLAPEMAPRKISIS